MANHKTILGLALLATLFSTLDGHPITVAPPLGEARPWTHPGTNPCGSLCERDWALEQMVSAGIIPDAVHSLLRQEITDGQPVAYYVASGDRIAAMTYAKNGIPFLDPSPRIAQFPEDRSYESAGYFVSHGGTGYWFVRIDYCGNWALILSPMTALFDEVPLVFSPGGIGTNAPIAGGAITPAGNQVSSRLPGGGGIAFPSFPGGGGILVPGGGGGGPDQSAPAPPAAVIPLPSPLYLLGSALTALIVFAASGPVRKRFS